MLYDKPLVFWSLKKCYCASPSLWPWLKLWWSLLSSFECLVNNSFQFPFCLVFLSVPGLNSLLTPEQADISDFPEHLLPILPYQELYPAAHILLLPHISCCHLFLCLLPAFSDAFCSSLCPSVDSRFICTPHHPHGKPFMLCPVADWWGPSTCVTCLLLPFIHSMLLLLWFKHS